MPPVDAAGEFGLDSNDQDDQSQKLQAAMDAAARDGRLLLLPSGGFNVHDLEIPDGLHLLGIHGHTLLTAPGHEPPRPYQGRPRRHDRGRGVPGQRARRSRGAGAPRNRREQRRHAAPVRFPQCGRQRHLCDRLGAQHRRLRTRGLRARRHPLAERRRPHRARQPDQRTAATPASASGATRRAPMARSSAATESPRSTTAMAATARTATASRSSRPTASSRPTMSSRTARSRRCG